MYTRFARFARNKAELLCTRRRVNPVTTSLVYRHCFFHLGLFSACVVRQREEIALFDLEESYHTEFGSVDLRYRD